MLALTKVEYWQDKTHYRSYGLFCGQTPARIAEQVVNWYGNEITDLNITPIDGSDRKKYPNYFKKSVG